MVKRPERGEGNRGRFTKSRESRKGTGERGYGVKSIYGTPERDYGRINHPRAEGC